MSEQTSRLAVIIDSSGAQKNTETLASSLSKLTQAGQKAADGAGKVTKATEDEAQALSQLLDRIDPVNSALNKLDQQQQQLAKFKAKGFLDTDTFDAYSKKIDDARSRLGQMSEQLVKTGQSSKQAAWAMKMIPAQMTDIVVGLSTGQSPFMVLMQQGGQLKDMFGGIGPAIKGIGSYVMGLVNPFTLGAAAVAGLGLAYYQGQQEQEAFQQSLILTGNQVGKTAGQLSDMARNVSLATGSTQGTAAGVINQLVSAGNIAGDSLQKIAGSIVNMSSVTGQATTQMVSDFESIAENPVQAISKLNDQYHFLTLATYNQIKALADEGNQQDAARVATDAYANAVNGRANDINKNLGTIESAWNAITMATKGAIDAMRDVGREQTLQQKLDAEKGGLGVGQWSIYNAGNAHSQGSSSEINILQAAVNAQNDMNGAISAGNKDQQEGIKAQQFINNLQDQSLSNAQKRTKEQNLLTESLKKTRAAGISISASEEATLRKNIDDKYKDPAQPKQRKGKAYSEDAGTKLIDQLNQQNAALTAQVDTSDKLSTAQQALVKWEQQLANIKGKSTLTAEQKSLLANQDKITALYQQNAALEKQQQLVKQSAALSGYQSNLNRDISSRNSQYSNDESVASGARSAYQQGILTQRITLEQQLNDKIIQLRQQRTSATTEIDRQTIDQEIAMQQSANDKMLADYDAHTQRMTAMRGSWSNGAEKAWQEYADSASNASGMTQTLFSDAFSSMEDAIVSFSTSGKLSFKGFANSVISDIARIAARMAISGVASSVIGGVSSLFGAPSATTSGNAGTALSGNGALGLSTSYTSYLQGGYDGGGFTGDGGKYDPAGIVHKGEFVFTKEATSRIGKDNLAKLMKGYSSGGYVGAPTTPLSSKRQQSSTGGDINLGGIVVNVDSNGKASSGSSTDGQGIGKQIQSAVINTINEQATKQGTPLWRAIKGR
ncbi:phage tail tape measure protein [Rosenbergiella australiborealis]|uniref:phage tail tape measure protein n=1 Tax=Rosenbergiella australiborealis TaxID=1544696 RepID=UPI001F4EEA25|nr:phage tail tape measure protein [Rosenbergiella australiborealis]